MIKIGIVEDDLQFCHLLEEYLKKFEEEHGVAFDITLMHDGDALLQKAKQHFDILLMDIQMPFVDGFSAAKEVRKHDEKVIIIFVTTIAQYAIRGYEVGALDYVLKPVEYLSLARSLNAACKKLEKEEKHFVLFKVKSGMQRIDVDDICYIESTRYTLCVHTLSENFEAYGTIKEYEQELAQNYFCRGNKGYLINLKYVKGIKEQCVLLRSESLLLSRGRKESFLQHLLNYWGEG